MRHWHFFVSSMLLLAWAVSPQLCRAADAPVFDIPPLDKITVDGKADDWGDKGFRVNAVTFDCGKLPAASDFGPSFRLAWNDRGLLVFITVKDDVNQQHDDQAMLYYEDSVTFFPADALGSDNVFNLVVSPGIDAKHPKLRTLWCDRRPNCQKLPKLTAELASAKIDGGYTIEALLPWENLGITPKIGRELALQIMFTDSDGPGSAVNNGRWYPLGGASEDTMLTHRIRLAQKPSKPVQAAAIGEYESLRSRRLGVWTDASGAGRKFVVTEGDKQIAAGELKVQAGRASALVALPVPGIGLSTGELAVRIDGYDPLPVDMPDIQAMRAEKVCEAPLAFKSFCFVGNKFPACEFKTPSEVQELLGTYKISAKYFDRDFNEVTTAQKPGRYGAVVAVEGFGREFRRFFTLYRLGDKAGSLDEALYALEIKAEIKFPPQWGLDPKVTAENSEVLSQYVGHMLERSAFGEQESAVIMAGLSEAKPGDKTDTCNDPYARDRAWWVRFKRKLYGTDREFTKPLERPQKVAGLKAPVVHDGSLKEAGMKSDARQKLDALCTEWGANSDVGFSVCVVRHGVVVLHQAYGKRNGKPMTLQTRSYIASITKTVAASLMWQFVDRGLVGLDDPVSKYIPTMRSTKASRPMMVRDLYVHSSGITGHWWDGQNDLEEIIGDLYPHLRVGQNFIYSGCAYAMGGKVMETVTGESLPELYRKHLLAPLGCKDTDLVDSGGGMHTTPMDLARIGQMILNKGAYGDLRFFSEKTFNQMLPQPLTKVLGPAGGKIWGIGMVWTNREGLPEGTFGHSSSTWSLLRVDPKDDLVIVQCREGPGANWEKYFPAFIKAIQDGIEQTQSATQP